MKFSAFIASAVALSGMVVHAHPGMGKILAELRARQDDGGADDEFDSNELIATSSTCPTLSSPWSVHAVKSIILGQGESGESDEVYRRIPARGTPACAKDTCCIWHYISEDMTSKFRGRSAVRLGFHDAAGWSKSTAPGGGADGSIILAPVEMTRPDNRGLEEIVAQMKKWYKKYKSSESMGANTATVVCPLVRGCAHLWDGRTARFRRPTKLLPNVFSDADTLIALFKDKTIRPHGLAALLGSHTKSQQRFVNTTRALDPRTALQGVFKFPSDVALSKDPRTGPEMAEFAGPDGQEHWNEYVRVSLLGVYNINKPHRVHQSLPPAIKRKFNPSDASIVEEWVDSTTR
ncbi:ligninase H2 [Auriculariales sp. MPI-PUGE-AT-0066]|nr:ligninase H2 [Auriculariales sp. MPI-PUGE-AT-0066]